MFRLFSSLVPASARYRTSGVCFSGSSIFWSLRGEKTPLNVGSLSWGTEWLGQNWVSQMGHRIWGENPVVSSENCWGRKPRWFGVLSLEKQLILPVHCSPNPHYHLWAQLLLLLFTKEMWFREAKEAHNWDMYLTLSPVFSPNHIFSYPKTVKLLSVQVLVSPHYIPR